MILRGEFIMIIAQVHSRLNPRRGEQENFWELERCKILRARTDYILDRASSKLSPMRTRILGALRGLLLWIYWLGVYTVERYSGKPGWPTVVVRPIGPPGGPVADSVFWKSRRT